MWCKFIVILIEKMMIIYNNNFVDKIFVEFFFSFVKCVKIEIEKFC